MSKQKLTTQFAPAERADEDTIRRQTLLLKKASHLLPPLYEAVTEIVMILNQERQIVYFNQNLLDFLKTTDQDSVYGMRAGEALSCIHARKLKAGCGTTEFCRTCGAANAIVNSQKGMIDIQECRISRLNDQDALDLQVKATPLEIEGEKFTIFAVKDISHEKRRRALEQIFFHDVMNTAACISMASELLPKNEIRQMLTQGVSELIDEIESQKILAAAESHELVVKISELSSDEVLTKLQDQYKKFAESKEVIINIESDTAQNFQSDQTILLRVLGNMLKNAIEASKPGESVDVSAKADVNNVTFHVSNPAFMPREVQLQMFQRSFSTKGSGRGLGTYSMKLLTERYLKGNISFTSNEKNGTTFAASFPLKLS